MKNTNHIYIIILTLLLFPQFVISEGIYSQFEYVESYKGEHDGCLDILDEDIVIYASKLYFDGKYLDSIKILNKVHLDHDSIYWLCKNEIAIADDVSKNSNTAYNKYIADHPSYFIFDKNLKRYIPTDKRFEESKKVYPNNEFLPEMEIYYSNIGKLKSLKIKPKK